jgi:predicted kinase
MKQLRLAKPHLLVMVGIPGSGKSSFAEKFTNTFGAPYVSQKNIEEHVTGDIRSLTQDLLKEFLKTNQLIVFDGSTDTRTDRIAIAKLAREAEYETLFIWVQTDEATARSRSKQLAGDEYNKQMKRFTPLNTSEKSLVISGKHTYASQAKVVLKKLSTPRAEISTHETPPLRPVKPGQRNIIVR